MRRLVATPSKIIHKMFERKVLHYSNEKLNSIMDIAWLINGQNHRDLWGHDLKSIIIASAIAGGDFRKNLMQALLHVSLDKSFSKIKKELIQSGVEPEYADIMLYYIAKELLHD